MSEDKKTMVVAVMPNHPSGQRNRAGLTFTSTPIVYEVTDEQEKMIREDKFLRVIERGTAFDDAMTNYKKKLNKSSDESDAGSIEGSEQLKSTDSDAGNNNPIKNPAEVENVSLDAKSEENNSEEEPKTSAPAKPYSRMNKDELIAALESKGLKSGLEFSPAAVNKDLIALLESL